MSIPSYLDKCYSSCDNYYSTGLQCCYEYDSTAYYYSGGVMTSYYGYNKLCDYASSCSANGSRSGTYVWNFYVWPVLLVIIICLRIARCKARE